jgi:hypothetical protein
MMADVGNDGRRVTNKTGYRTAISKMATTNVLRIGMCHIIGHKNKSFLDCYDDTFEVAREAAMHTLELGAVGVLQLNVQYPMLKNQVTKDFIQHHVVNVSPNSTLITSITFEARAFYGIEGQGTC